MLVIHAQGTEIQSQSTHIYSQSTESLTLGIQINCQSTQTPYRSTNY